MCMCKSNSAKPCPFIIFNHFSTIASIDRIVAVEHQDIDIGPYIHNIPANKSIPHEQGHEENIYEFIPENVQGPNGHYQPAVPNKHPVVNSRPSSRVLNDMSKIPLSNRASLDVMVASSNQASYVDLGR